MRTNRSLMVFMLILTIGLVVGCVPSTMMKPIDRDNAGWWDKYMVLPLSDLLDWIENFVNSYGISIIVVTIIVRLIVLPLTLKQQKSSREMQTIQPEIQKIKEKFKDNRQKVGEETMKLFQKHEINPLAGCLPSLVQIPILFAFYQAIMKNSHIAEAHFMYMQLGKPDPIYIFPFLAALVTYVQFLVTGTGDNPQMKVILWFMPIMIFLLAYNFPAALSLYWVVGGAFSILQYILLIKPHKRIMANK